MDKNTEDTPVEASANEVEARTAGWVPKEEYNGDENKWVDADEFVRRGPLFEKINLQNRELKEVKKTLAQLAAHHAQVKEVAYKDALATLKAQKREAFTDGDPDKIIAIDEKIDEIKAEQRNFEYTRAQEAKTAVQQEVHPEFESWTNRNPWYNNSLPMRAFADALGVELRAKGLTPTNVLKEVEKQVREEFPKKFQNPNREKPGTVEGASKGSGSKAESYDMTDLERDVMRRFVRQGVMSEKEYIAELKRTKENQ